VTLRQRIARTLAGTLIFLAALISVGLAAPADGLFSIDVKPVFLRLDAAALTEPHASALGLDVDIRIWTLRLHFTWSAVPMAAPTHQVTACPPDLPRETTQAQARREPHAQRRAGFSSTKSAGRLL